MAGLGAKNWMFQEEVTSSDVNGYLADQVVMRFADATARTAAFGGVGEPTLAEGMVSYLDSEKRMEVYNGTAWVAVDVNGSLASQVVFRFADAAARDAAFGGPGELALVEGMICTLNSTDEVQRYSGTDWVSINADRDRNVIINGAMQVSQRGTSTANITSNATASYFGPDRFATPISSMGTWTQSQEVDAPTGSGFRNSLKMLCTTAQASPSAGAYVQISQRIEGFNCQKFAKGTASATKLTVSFWVKTSSTGTFIVALEDSNSRYIASSYSVASAGVWEKKTITFAADTTGTIVNTNATGLNLLWWLGSGTTYTSGTLQTSWGPNTTAANLAAGQVNLAAAINNYWQVTGVQLEAGPVATPFEFEEYGTTLAKCQRYYFRRSAGGTNANFGSGWSTGTTNVNCFYELPTRMRATPSGIDTGGSHQIQQFSNSTFTITGFTYQSGESSDTRAMVSLAATGMGANSGAVHRANGSTAYIGFSAEL